MKAVMISIRPKWCELIASGKKTVEVRKTRPKLETPFKCYIYCTNTRPYLVWADVFYGNWETEFTHLSRYNRKDAEEIWDVFNGKVIGEFVCNSIGTVGWTSNPAKSDWKDGYNEETCLTNREAYEYTKGELFYEWYISDLEIYTEPRELGEYRLKRPPQSWCYVESED